MAKNEIILKLTVDDKGSLKLTAAQAEKTAKSIDKTTAATKKRSKAQEGLNVKQNKHNKLEKGTGQLGMNSTKAFAKQAQTLGGTLVPAYATLAANIFALTAAFGALQRAAAFEQLRDGLVMVGSAAGKNLPYVAGQLREIAGEAISTKEAMSAVALGTASGFSTEQLEQLTKVAKGASLALGRNMEDAMSRLVRGTAKVEPEILDELGIMVRLDAAVEKYATKIGKTGAQLTQFERSQAFLNATIEEGIEKFEFVADAVEANPYDKLISSFADLQKQGFKFINMVLGPVSEFLSSNPTALIGVLVAFGATIVSKIIPGVNELAKQQRKIAQFNAKEAKLASVRATQAYKDSLKAIQIPNFAPKSIQPQAEALKNANISTKELKASVISLQKSEQLRQGWIKTYAQDQERYSDTFIRKKKEELVAIQKTRRAYEDAIKRQKEIRGAGAGVAVARGKSIISTRQAKALEAIDSAGFVNSWKIAAKESSRHFDIIGKAGVKGFGLVKLSASAARASVSLFGRAVLNAIPILGQVLMFGSLLLPVFSKMFGKSELKEQVDEIVESFESFDDIAKQLAVTLSNPFSRASEKAVAIMRAEVGVLEQVASGLDKVNQKRREGLIKERIEAAKDAYEAEKRLNEIGYDPQKVVNRISQTGKLAEANSELAESAEKLALVDTESALSILYGAETALMATGDVKPEAFDNVKRAVQELQNIILEAEGTLTRAKLDKLLAEKLEGAGQKALKALDTVSSAVQNFDKEVTKIQRKQLTPFDNMIDSFKSFQNEFNELFKFGETTKDFVAENKEMVEKIESYYAQFHTPTRTALADLKDKADFYADSLDRQRQILIDSKGLIAQYSVALKNINAIAKDNEVAATESFRLQKEIVYEKLRQLEAEDSIRRQVDAQIKHEQEKVALQDELNRLKAIESATIAIAGIKQRKREFGYMEKIMKAEQTVTKELQKQEKILQKLRANREGLGLSPRDEYAMWKKQKEERLELVAEEALYRLEAIDLEYALLRAQVDLEIAKAAHAKEDTKIYKNYLNLLDKGQKAAEAAAMATFTSQSFEISGEGAGLQKAIYDADMEERWERRAMFEERIALTQNEQLIRATQLETLAQKRTVAVRELNIARMLGKDTTEQQLALDKLDEEIWRTKVEHARAFHEEIETILGIGTSDAFAFMTNLQASAGVYADDAKSVGDKLIQMGQDVQPFVETLKSLGPEGEFIAQIADSAFMLTSVWMTALEQISAAGENTGMALAAGFAAAAASIGAVASILAAQSNAAISRIDEQIAAEKKRDGQSAASVAKLNTLEKKKDKMAKKSFEVQKKLQLAQAIMSTAAGVASALSGPVPPPWSFALAALVAALGAAQVAIIAGTSYGGGSKSAEASVPKSITVGERVNRVDLATARSPSGELAYARGERGVGGMSNFIPTFTGRAAGGTTGIIAGEQGPELIIPQVPTTVLPADDTEELVSRPSTTVNFNINAIDTQGMEEALMNQQGHIINLIRQAANDHGEFFLENVSTYER